MESTRTLARETWCEYFEALTREQRNASVSIETADATRSPVPQGNLFLQELAYDGRDDAVELAATRSRLGKSRSLRLRFDHPKCVAVDSETMLAPMTVRVDARDGVRTLITFRSEPDIGG